MREIKLNRSNWFYDETNPLGKKEYVIIVEDIFGVETKVRSTESVFVQKQNPDYIKCKVDGIRKGKAILSFDL